MAIKVRQIFSPLLVVAAMLCFAASFAPFILGNFCAMAISRNEYNELIANDRPKSYASLTFDSWQVGPGQLYHSHILDLPTDAEIARHRVGRDFTLWNIFTYYEAEYVFSDGTKRVTHASGPVPMFTARRSTVYGGLALGWLLALMFALLAIKFQTSADDKVTKQAE